MRQQPSGRRPRGRSNRKQYISPKSQIYDSHGPNVRVRGNAMQAYEKYLNLARDASSSGDWVAAEGYYQFAEHYFRIVNDSTDPQRAAPVPELIRHILQAGREPVERDTLFNVIQRREAEATALMATTRTAALTEGAG